MESKWYAVYTKPRWEKKVSETLNKEDFESYCPLNLVVHQWSDRKKKVSEPLFKCYVFVRTTEDKHHSLKQHNGVINLVNWLNKPAIIRDCEIEAIRDFLGEYKNVRIERTEVNVNDMVRIVRGPLMEQEGNVISIKSNTVKIVLPSLGYLMMAEVDKASIEILNNKNSFSSSQQPAINE